MPTKIEISARTIVFTVFFLLFLKFLWIIRDLIFSLFIAFIIASALRPLVNFLMKKKLPRLLAVVLVYLIFLSIIFNIFAFIIRPLFNELISLFKNLPFIVEKSFPLFPHFLTPDLLSQYLSNLTPKVFNLASGIFSNAIFVTSTLFFGLYLLAGGEDIFETAAERFFDKEEKERIMTIFNRAEKRMRDWFWGELILMIVVGVLTFIGLNLIGIILTFIGLNLIGIKYVLFLSFLAGLLELIPNLGPVIATVPAFLIGISQSYFLGFTTIALYFIIQQLENNFIVPLVMKKAVNLAPMVTLIALIIGGKLAGVMGALLAIPTTLFIETVLVEVIKREKNHK